MKQLIIGVILAILLVGCGEKPKFSINASDTQETYDNNSAFTKIEASANAVEGTKEEKAFAYQFASAPISIYDMETGDLNLLGGTILIIDKQNTNVTLTMKGKESFDKLKERLNKLKAFKCSNVQIGNSRGLNCMSSDWSDRIVVNASYNYFSNITSLNYTKLL